ncbi:MAG: EAL domain-containing protein, partial [Pseudonocardia sp.]|nr:EAL domain-containing protein [Pseudonocardia sp.]
EQEAIRVAGQRAHDDAERGRRASDQRFRAVFTGALMAIGIGDLHGDLIDVNQTLAAMLGLTPEGMVGRPIVEFVHPEDRADVREEVRTRLTGGDRDGVRLEKRFVRRDGGVRWVRLALSVVRGEDGEPAYLVAMGEDVTESRRLERRLEHQARHDPLTGLPNRALFFEALDHLFTEAGAGDRVGVCFLDLDRFKVVNDTYGHRIGDELLVAVAARLGEVVDGTEWIAARMSGDEFVILVPDCSGTEEMVLLAERVAAAVGTPVHAHGHRVVVDASIGVVQQPVAWTHPEELMHAADVTLRWAKEDGKGRWVLFDDDRYARQVAREELSAALPAAIRGGELLLDYQPIVDLDGGRLLGVEALVRWRHPELGVLPPDSFVPLAEENGLIVPLGRWVLRTACRQARRWLDVTGDVSRTPCVSVNLAVRQLSSAGVVDDVAGILAETGLPPALLLLEITESAVMDRSDGSVAALRALAAMGVRIALDDFGTGYSNLAYLRDLPLHALKLAGAFLDGLRTPLPAGASPDEERLLAALVSLGHALGLTVIAENVETPTQRDLLHRLRCDAGQGWLIGGPGSPESVLALLDAAVRDGGPRDAALRDGGPRDAADR